MPAARYLYEEEQRRDELRKLSVNFAPGYSHRRRELIETVAVRLNDLLKLEPGWDGFRARQVSELAALTALEWLNLLADDDTVTPQVFPLVGGGVQIEWLAAGDALEVEFSPDGSVGILGVDSAGNVIVEGDYPEGVDFVASARKHLSALSHAVSAALFAV